VNANIVTPTEILEHLHGLISTADSDSALLLIKLHGLKRMGTIVGARHIEEIISDLTLEFENGIRPDDAIYRTGRFEFIILISKILNQGHAVLAANKIAGILSSPIKIDGQDRKHAFSVGIALTPKHTTDPEQLFRYAELASIAAQRTHKPYQLYSPDEMRHVVTDWDIEGDLERAIANNELSLHYQPQISAHTGKVLGAEALMRWVHPDHGSVPPSQFIPVAERIGIMPKLTWWCLNTALRERLLWREGAHNLSVGVNISAFDLTDGGFAAAVTNSVGIWNTRPESLILEITEGSFMQDISLSASILNKLHNYGIRISIDDFGTGYSSLSYFQQLPADELKIDRSFIRNILDDELNQHIVSTIIQMANKMHLNIVVEGIESAETQQALTELGCHTIQGYHVARPMSQQDFIAWLAAHRQPLEV
jgi:EAL domain-containing protein (putative c-di-GMP-specific phosphodiesterase class I)/GGDEF domain-containing protein